jgi:Pyridine nucleotide-disulphide oxidoreductase
MTRSDLHIAILGAGPIGIEAALYAAALKLPFTLYERGAVGDHLRHWGHVRLFSPFAWNCTPLGRASLRAENPRHELPHDNDLLTGREHITHYLDPISQLPALRDRVRLKTAVLSVSRRGVCKEEAGDAHRADAPFRLLLRGSDGKEFDDEADVVLDCTGVYGTPRWLGDGGAPAPGETTARAHIPGGLEDVLGDRRKHYADRTTLVVGAGFSAATTVCGLASLAQDHGSTWVIWVARGSGTQPMRRIANDPLRERDQLAARANHLATRGEGLVEFHPQTVLHRIDWLGDNNGFRVEANCAGARRTWEVERIIGQAGYEPNINLFRELQVQLCHCTMAVPALASVLLRGKSNDGVGVPPQGPAGLRTTEPGFYILGARSNGRMSGFLLRQGFEQVKAVFALLTGKSDLDLYRKR